VGTPGLGFKGRWEKKKKTPLAVRGKKKTFQPSLGNAARRGLEWKKKNLIRLPEGGPKRKKENFHLDLKGKKGARPWAKHPQGQKRKKAGEGTVELHSGLKQKKEKKGGRHCR